MTKFIAALNRRRLPQATILVFALALVTSFAVSTTAQESAEINALPRTENNPNQAAAAGSASGGLSALVQEALLHSPMVAAARTHWQAQTKAPIQARTLPDPIVQFQQLTVGSPQPFSGYETSDFYYSGFGFSQDIPGPGKLGLQGLIAEKDAEYARHHYEAAQREVAERVREGYFEAFVVVRTLEILDRNRSDLEVIEQVAEQRYRVGQGLQQDVVKAQLQITELLKQEQMLRQELQQRQVQLKAIVGRDPDSQDITIGDVEPTNLELKPSELTQLAAASSPELKMQRSMEERSDESLKLARKGYLPDFSIGYMYQKTGPGFRDYYVLSLGAKIPLYFWRKQTPAIEQASLESQSARAQTRASELDVTASAQSELVALQTAGRVLTIYRNGLIPQAQNSMDAAMAAYRVGKVDFQTLLSAFIDLLNLNQEYYRELADHEIAVAKIEQIIGDVK